MTRRNLLRSIFITLCALPLTTDSNAALPAMHALPENNDSHAKQVQQALEALIAAQSADERAQAIESLPFGIKLPYKHTSTGATEFTWLTYGESFQPFDTKQFAIQGHNELIPSTLRLLEARLRGGIPGIFEAERDADILLAGTVLAAIGSNKAIHDGLPKFLQAITRNYQNDISTSNQELLLEPHKSALCLVTLCGRENVAKCIADVTYSSNPIRRIAAVRVLSAYSGRLRAYNTSDKYLVQAFDASLPCIVRVATIDPDKAVRIEALDSLHDCIDGSASAPWLEVLPYLHKAALATNRETVEQRILMRVLAAMPLDSTSVFPAYRKYLSSSDDLTRGYALVTLLHATLVNQEAIAKIYINDIASKDANRRADALNELATASDVVWGYGSWANKFPGGIYPESDHAMSFAGYAIRNANQIQLGQHIVSTAQNPVRNQLLDAIVRYGLTDKRSSIRASAAQALLKIGNSVDKTLSHGGQYRIAEPDEKPVYAALVQASAAIRSDDVSLSQDIDQLAQRFTGIRMVF